ncbi:MAG: DUF1385 domain-containing protein [Desulfovibrionaceae bacterium]|nr:DUF1385 domain-containing protein [Desulfovibrionaceae bacterium]
MSENQGRDCPSIGGQAVIEGVMMRRGDEYSLAVRRPDGSIATEVRPWFRISRHPWMNKPFVRGFPLLVETLINGIQALNRSAELSSAEDEPSLSSGQLILSMTLSIVLTAGLFIVAPHLLSLGMETLGIGGSMNGFVFHLWDGLFKLLIFIGYIAGIACFPEIRRVFRYHGAEHKAIHAYELGMGLNAEAALGCSRLHPRCGTTFLLLVMGIAITLHAIFLPAFLSVWSTDDTLVRHGIVMLLKLFLFIPISTVAYEAVRFSSRLTHSFWGPVLRAPGLALQRLTAWEPDFAQEEVAVAAIGTVLHRKADADTFQSE